MKIRPRLVLFDLSDCTLRISSGYDFSIFLILLFLDRYFGIFDSDLRASPPPVCLAMECSPPHSGGNLTSSEQKSASCVFIYCNEVYHYKGTKLDGCYTIKKKKNCYTEKEENTDEPIFMKPLPTNVWFSYN